MTTVSALIERAYRDFLDSVDDQPTRFTLDGALTDSATSLTYDDSLLSPEEEDILGPGTVIEIGSEEIVVGAIDAAANSLTSLIRGANGTTAAAHSDGAVGKVAPTWRRRSVFDAVCDAVEALYPELFAVATQALTVSTTGPTDVSADVAFPLWFYGRTTGSSSWGKYEVRFLDVFPDSSTDKAIEIDGLCGSLTGDLVYAKSFDRPTSEATDLTTLGVEQSWDRLVIVSAVAYLMSGREADPVAQNLLSEQQEAQNFPVGSASRLRDSLIREFEYLLQKAKKQQRSRYRTTVTRSW